MWKILKKWEYQTTIPVSWETCMSQLDLDMEQLTSLKLGKENVKANILSSWLFNFYAEYFMWNAELDISYAEIKISGRNINNSDMQMRLHYSGIWCYNGTIMAESKEELKSLLIGVKEESEKAGLKLNIKETKIMVSGPITSWQIEGEKWKQWQNLFSWVPKSLWWQLQL